MKLPAEDSWVSRIEREAYQRLYGKDADQQLASDRQQQLCRPATSGVQVCDRPVVRGGRCILHAPKFTEAEKRTMSASEVAEQNTFDERFRKEFLAMLRERPSMTFQGIRFPTMQWNQHQLREVFSGAAVFLGTVFDQSVNMSSVAFGGDTRFVEAIFREGVHFGCSAFVGEALFSSCVFEGPVTFEGATFLKNAQFSHSRFMGPCKFSFAKIQARLWFKGEEGNPMISKADFTRLQIGEHGQLHFELVDLSSASFLNTDLTKARFQAVRWHRKQGWWRLGRIFRRPILFDEAELRGQAHANFDAVADKYRELVLNAEAHREFEAAEEFHFGEWEVRRLQTGADTKPRVWRLVKQRFGPVGLYGLLSAYGCSYLRALAWLAVFSSIFAGGFRLTGLGVRDEPSARTVHEITAGLVHVASILTFQRERMYSPRTYEAHLLEAAATVFLSGQAALVLLAIRRNFKR